MAKSKDKKEPARKTFQQAVSESPEVSKCWQAGKAAILGKERSKVEFADNSKCGGSLFIDQCLVDQNLYTQENRWDYAIDYNGEVFFIEVHGAKSNEVKTVIRKLEWLKRWLRIQAPEIDKLKAKSKTPYYWVQTDGYDILKNSSYERQAVQNGIKPISKLKLG